MLLDDEVLSLFPCVTRNCALFDSCVLRSLNGFCAAMASELSRTVLYAQLRLLEVKPGVIWWTGAPAFLLGLLAGRTSTNHSPAPTSLLLPQPLTGSQVRF